MNIPIHHHRSALPALGAWRVLVALDLVAAICALGGGLALAARPDGYLLQMPRSMLEGSPFLDYLVPGLALAALVGGGHLWGGLLARRRSPAAPLMSFTAAAGMLIWMGVQLAVFRGRMWLQPTIVLLAAAVLTTALTLRSPPELWRDLRDQVAERPLAWFFAMTFAFTWLHVVPEIAAVTGHMAPLSRPASFALRAFSLAGGPAGSAALVLALSEGRAGFAEWGRSLVRFRAPLHVYLVVLLGYPAIAAVSLAASALIRGVPAPFEALFQARLAEMAAGLGMDPGGAVVLLPVLLAYGFLVVPLYEEPGWRAFALPRLRRKLRPVETSIALGAIWAAWHLPNFFIPGTPHHGMPFAGFVAELISFSVLMTWAFNRGGGSAALAILFHGSVIAGSLFLPAGIPGVTGDRLAFWIAAGLSVAAAFACRALAGPGLGSHVAPYPKAAAW